MVENVVVVVVDALRADRVGVYNDEYADLTPVINDLGDRGTIFTNAFTTINTTDPAMTSLHTGRHPKGHGVHNHGDRVTDSEKERVQQVTMFPELLSHKGFNTIKAGRALGRWHKRGFETYPEVGDFDETNKNPIIDFWDTHLETRMGRVLYGISDRLGHLAAKAYRRFRGSEEASSIDVCLDAIDEADRGPFYSLIHLMDTHASYQPREDLIRENLDRYDDAENTPLSELADEYGVDTVTGERCEYWSRRYSNWKGEKHGVGTAHIAARYDGAVREADEKIGRLVAGLDERGLREETMIVVLADHGESLTDHGILHDHHGLYDCTTQIPLVVDVPDESSTRRDDFVQITDIAPTVLDYLGVETDVAFDGRSLRPLVSQGDGWTARDSVLAEEAHTQRRRMIRTRNEKYIRLLEGDTVCRYCGIEHAPPKELYDIGTDPSELDNHASERPERVDELRERMSERLDGLFDAPDSHGRAAEYGDEEEILEQFEALGYR
jgi:arylsulfatase A-like enzyme